MIALHYQPERLVWPGLEEYPAHLHIDLLPPFQGAGHGRALMETFYAAAARAGAAGVHVTVTTANTRALGFYDRLGFRRLEISQSRARPRHLPRPQALTRNDRPWISRVPPIRQDGVMQPRDFSLYGAVDLGARQAAAQRRQQAAQSPSQPGGPAVRPRPAADSSSTSPRKPSTPTSWSAPAPRP